MPPSIDFDDELIAGVIGLAARELSARASMQGITVLIAWPYRCDRLVRVRTAVGPRRPLLVADPLASGTRGRPPTSLFQQTQTRLAR